jgi:hypothetical protein
MEGSLEVQDMQSMDNNKSGMSVRIMCEAVPGYICDMEVYAAEENQLENTMLSILDKFR